MQQRSDQAGVLIFPQTIDGPGPDLCIPVFQRQAQDRIEIKFDVALCHFDQRLDDFTSAGNADLGPDFLKRFAPGRVHVRNFGQHVHGQRRAVVF